MRGDDAFAERRKLEGERAVGIEAERTAVEHDLVLSADGVEIDQRQAALDHARDRDVEPHLRLVAMVGRAVRHQQDLAAGLRDAFDDVRPPDVLADRNTDAHALEHDRARHWPRRKHPLLVEHAVVRQIDLVARRSDLAAFKVEIGVVELAVVHPGHADQHGRTVVRRLARERFDRRPARRLEGGLEYEVLGHVARDEQLGENNEIGALLFRLRARLAHFLRVAGDIADSRIELRERDGEAVGGTGVHEQDLAMRAAATAMRLR